MSKKYKTNGWICPNNYEFIRQIRDSSKMNVYRRTWFNPQWRESIIKYKLLQSSIYVNERSWSKLSQCSEKNTYER